MIDPFRLARHYTHAHTHTKHTHIHTYTQVKPDGSQGAQITGASTASPVTVRALSLVFCFLCSHTHTNLCTGDGPVLSRHVCFRVDQQLHLKVSDVFVFPLISIWLLGSISASHLRSILEQNTHRHTAHTHTSTLTHTQCSSGGGHGLVRFHADRPAPPNIGARYGLVVH